MTDTPLEAELAAEYETELSRLGSSKAIYALTGGEMEPATVEAALAGRFAAAAAAFEGWGGDVPAPTAMDTADEIARTLADEPDPDATPLEATLRELDAADARLGGLLAWTLITDRTLAQAVGFFVGNADPQGADRFRGFRTEVDTLRAHVADHLDDPVGAGAEAAASRVIEAAYDHYVATLESLGVKVKPVC